MRRLSESPRHSQQVLSWAVRLSTALLGPGHSRTEVHLPRIRAGEEVRDHQTQNPGLVTRIGPLPATPAAPPSGNRTRRQPPLPRAGRCCHKRLLGGGALAPCHVLHEHVLLAPGNDHAGLPIQVDGIDEDHAAHLTADGRQLPDVPKLPLLGEQPARDSSSY